MKMNVITKITYALLVIGGLNWGLVGFLNFNLVNTIFSIEVARVIYALVGVAALYGVYSIVSMKNKSNNNAGRK